VAATETEEVALEVAARPIGPSAGIERVPGQLRLTDRAADEIGLSRGFKVMNRAGRRGYWYSSPHGDESAPGLDLRRRSLRRRTVKATRGLCPPREGGAAMNPNPHSSATAGMAGHRNVDRASLRTQQFP
jgi:hypothetical protein